MTALTPIDELTELHYRRLADLAPAIKERLIVKLQASLREPQPQADKRDILSFCGAWDDEGDVDELVREIYESRTSAPQRAFFD